MKPFSSISILFVSVIFLSSCVSKKKMVYFEGIEEGVKDSELTYSPRYKADDQLLITVSSLDNEAAIPFNLPVIPFNNITSGNRLIQGGQGNLRLQAYLISEDGNIEFPQIGTLKMAGLTRLEATKMLEEKLRPFLEEPLVNIRLLSFNVTVLGEVRRPGRYSIGNERVTILEVIGLAGDLTIFGRRNNILIIRETDQGDSYNRVDLTSPTVFESPVYYLQQNDVVYVEPNKPKINSSVTSSANGLIISTVSILLSVISLLIRI